MAEVAPRGDFEPIRFPPCLCTLRDAHRLDALAATVVRTDRLFLALDYDGTLTPIVGHASAATLSQEARKTLALLAESRDLTVAVLSGRALSDVQSRVGISHVIYAGNHGLEIAGPDWSHVEPEAERRRTDLQTLAQRLAEELAAVPGAWVEDKGLTLCVHYRQAEEVCWPTVHETVRKVCQGTETWLRVQPGKRTWDLRPSLECHKGTAAAYIRRRVGLDQAFAVGIGDDVTDEDLFAALRDGLTIHVGLDHDTRACCRVAGPAEVLEFLGWLARVRGLAGTGGEA